MRFRLARAFALACTLTLVVPFAAGCGATAPTEEAYLPLAAESYRTTLLVASEIFATYDRIESESPLPPEPMPAELFEGMDKRIADWHKAIEQEERRLSAIEPPAGYGIVHDDLLTIDRAMLAALERLADVEDRRADEHDLGDLRREVNEAFYDESEFAFELDDILPKVAPTADTLGVYLDNPGDQLLEIFEEGGW
jgi:hypothetical protein